MRGRSFGEMPIPVSSTSKSSTRCESYLSGFASNLTVTLPSSVYFRAFPTRLVSTWRSLPGFGTNKPRTCVKTFEKQFQILRTGALLQKCSPCRS